MEKKHHTHEKRHSREHSREKRHSRDKEHERRSSHEKDKERRDSHKKDRRDSHSREKEHRGSHEKEHRGTHDHGSHPEDHHEHSYEDDKRRGEEQEYYERFLIDSTGGLEERDYHERKRVSDLRDARMLMASVPLPLRHEEDVKLNHKDKDARMLMATVPLPLRHEEDVKLNHNNPTVNLHLPVPTPPAQLGPRAQLQPIQPIETDYPGHHHERWYFFWPPGAPPPGTPGGPPPPGTPGGPQLIQAPPVTANEDGLCVRPSQAVQHLPVGAGPISAVQPLQQPYQTPLPQRQVQDWAWTSPPPLSTPPVGQKMVELEERHQMVQTPTPFRQKMVELEERHQLIQTPSTFPSPPPKSNPPIFFPQNMITVEEMNEATQTPSTFASPTATPSRVGGLVVLGHGQHVYKHPIAYRDAEVSTIYMDSNKNYVSRAASPIASETQRERRPETREVETGPIYWHNATILHEPPENKKPSPNMCQNCGIGQFKRKVTTAGYLAAVLLFPIGTYACLKKKWCAVDCCNYCGHYKPTK